MYDPCQPPQFQSRPQIRQPLWRLMSFGRQRLGPASGYWFDNRDRVPRGLVVFQYTISGQLFYRDANGEQFVGPGAAMLCTYGEESSYGLTAQCTTPYVCEWMNLLGSGVLEHWQALRQRHGSVLHFGRDRHILKLMRALTTQASPQTARDAITLASATHDFIMQLYRHAEQTLSSAQKPVERAVDEILRNPTFPWSLKALADRHDCSREHLSRSFHQRVGMAPGEFIKQARIRRANELLIATDLSITAVAAQAGFTSPHALARHIRQTTGLSPTGYREQLRQGGMPRLHVQ